jgi:hypothetical protein
MQEQIVKVASDADMQALESEKETAQRAIQRRRNKHAANFKSVTPVVDSLVDQLAKTRCHKQLTLIQLFTLGRCEIAALVTHHGIGNWKSSQSPG